MVADQRVVGRCRRPRHAHRGHFPVAQLAQDFFPSLAIEIEMGEIQGLQIQLAARARAEWQESQ
jgi:hypothetical protein